MSARVYEITGPLTWDPDGPSSVNTTTRARGITTTLLTRGHRVHQWAHRHDTPGRVWTYIAAITPDYDRLDPMRDISDDPMLDELRGVWRIYYRTEPFGSGNVDPWVWDDPDILDLTTLDTDPVLGVYDWDATLAALKAVRA